jgi:sporulation protein YlmC with PRC-barrel domain
MEFEQIISVNDIASKEVIDGVGRKLGKVDDLIFDPVNNSILFVVVSVGGFLGTDMGAEYFGIPFESLEINPNTQTFTLRMDKSIVEESPRFKIEDIYHDDHHALTSLYEYYGQPGSWTKRPFGPTTDQGNDPYYSWGQHQAFEGSSDLDIEKENEPSKLSENMDYDKLKGNK